MKVYILEDKDSFLSIVDDSKIRLLYNGFNGKPMKESWEDILLEDIKPNIKKYDISKLSCNPIFTENAVSALNDLMVGKVEILPYTHKTEKYFAINVVNVLNCVDFSKADCQKYTDGFVKSITKYAFYENMIMDETIFKIPEFIATEVFVTDQFRDRVLEAKLTGFEFIEVWDSSKSSEKETVIEEIQYQGESYPFKEAVQLVMQGKTLASDKWLMQLVNGELYIRRTERNGSFTWVQPIFIPPVLLDLQWYIVDKVNYPEK
ncbi:hypothetical protein SK3146_02895 [Paenibacillus konkukensis]|uniref:Immunity MXAN-0049 protein domain-containing protein n=1 Tax=Paenibacillus konkukensis TaxID=2020716 RepID=A0ABY4RND5_9BACL|nr:DUF1629 domain-containing protein [Paenibacillus konkukensis]UQZ83688.1 hypothetical protein SK3146_02895 [Paenibacillus konkukensis]